MKKLRKIISALIVFFIMTNSVYSITNNSNINYFGFKKTIVLAAGAFLIIAILWINFKRDKEQEDIKEKNNSKPETESINNSLLIEENIKMVEEIKKEKENLFKNEKREEIETLSTDKKEIKPIKDRITKIEKKIIKKRVSEKQIDLEKDKKDVETTNKKNKDKIKKNEKVSKKKISKIEKPIVKKVKKTKKTTDKK